MEVQLLEMDIVIVIVFSLAMLCVILFGRYKEGE